jgi:hypothetical protein
MKTERVVYFSLIESDGSECIPSSVFLAQCENDEDETESKPLAMTFRTYVRTICNDQTILGTVSLLLDDDRWCLIPFETELVEGQQYRFNVIRRPVQNSFFSSDSIKSDPPNEM